MQLTPEYVQCKTDLMIRQGVPLPAVLLVRLLFRSGSRIGALLRMSYKDILPDNTCIIRQGKGSEILRCSLPEPLSYFAQCSANRQDPFSYINYTYVYRLLKSYALTMPHQFGTNCAVSASARKSLAQALEERGEELQNIARILGHKSAKSTEYYLSGASHPARVRKGILSPPSGSVENLTFTRNGIVKRHK